MEREYCYKMLIKNVWFGFVLFYNNGILYKKSDIQCKHCAPEANDPVLNVRISEWKYLESFLIKICLCTWISVKINRNWNRNRKLKHRMAVKDVTVEVGI